MRYISVLGCLPLVDRQASSSQPKICLLNTWSCPSRTHSSRPLASCHPFPWEKSQQCLTWRCTWQTPGHEDILSFRFCTLPVLPPPSPGEDVVLVTFTKSGRCETIAPVYIAFQPSSRAGLAGRAASPHRLSYTYSDSDLHLCSHSIASHTPRTHAAAR